MSAVQLAGSLLREAVRAALAQRVFTLASLLVVAGCTITTIVTAGQSAASQEAVLGQIDAQGTRTVVVQAKGREAGLTPALVDALARVDAVEAVVGFGPVTDATVAAVPDGPKIGVRAAYGRVGDEPLREPARGLPLRTVWTSASAAAHLGLPPGRGALRLTGGEELLVTHSLAVPAYLSDEEPLAVVPVDSPQHLPRLSSVVVLARRPADVDAVVSVVRGLLVDVPSDGASVQTSSAMAALRSAVDGELTRQTRGLVLGLLGAALAATSLNVWAMVLVRRKDYGRRRALGATRLTIVVLVVLQLLIPAVVGAALGVASAVSWLTAAAAAPPSLLYCVGVAAALVCAAALAAALPAVFAARRDPLRELRVP